MGNEHAGHRQRMRERFRTHGLEGFAPHEVLELMLFYAIPQRNLNPLAHRLIKHFGTFGAVLEAPVEELTKVEGMGEYAATLLKLFAEVSRRYTLSPAQERRALTTRSEAEKHCAALLHGCRQEHFYAVCLDAQMRVIQDELIARGTLSEVPAYPRIVVEAVLRYNAHAVILCHNHPGGSSVPSAKDLEMTRRISEVLIGIGVLLIDHVVVADGEWTSMVRCGLLRLENGTNGMEFRAADSASEVRIRASLEERTKKKK